MTAGHTIRCAVSSHTHTHASPRCTTIRITNYTPLRLQHYYFHPSIYSSFPCAAVGTSLLETRRYCEGYVGDDYYYARSVEVAARANPSLLARESRRGRSRRLCRLRRRCRHFDRFCAVALFVVTANVIVAVVVVLVVQTLVAVSSIVAKRSRRYPRATCPNVFDASSLRWTTRIRPLFLPALSSSV